MSIEEKFPLGSAIINLVLSHRSITTKRIRALGLYPGQDVILLELLDHDDCLQNDLVNALGIDHSTVTKSVSRLQRNAIVTTHKSTVDRRATLVSLTSKGRHLAQQVSEIWTSVEQLGFQTLTPAEQTSYLQLMHHITATFNQADQAPADSAPKS